MFTLRCTQRLLSRLKTELANESVPPTTQLGDWYANLLHVGRRQFVLGVSEKTFLPALVSAAPISTLVPRLRVGVGDMLLALGVPDAAVAREIAQMDEVAYAKTASRQVLGIMNDFARPLGFFLDEEPSLLAVALKLAETPCSPLCKPGGAISPDRTTVALFARPPLWLVH